jgi:uncharacterized protein (DUF1330 family)
MAAEKRRHVKLIGLHVRDGDLYRRYREGMTPLLHRQGGAFGYDFVVSDVLESEVKAQINRVFTITFPDAFVADHFFSDPEYLAVRKEFFEPAVGDVTVIGAYDEDVK